MKPLAGVVVGQAIALEVQQFAVGGGAQGTSSAAAGSWLIVSMPQAFSKRKN